jgi:hypothetical protein
MLLPMFQRDRLVAIHSESNGHLTLIDAERPDREHTFSLRDFFAN